MKRYYLIIIFCFLLIPGFSDKIIISQIDNSSLLINQKIQVYFSLIDNKGQPVTNLNKNQIQVFENNNKRKIIDFKSKINMNQGINLFIVLDNSGSMYDDASGNPTDDPEKQRMSFAKKAVHSLLSQIKNPQDKTGFMSFNTRIGSLEDISNDNVRIELGLEKIKQPETPEESYTELNEAVYFSIERMSGQAGRKVIIFLSDGENFPNHKSGVFEKRHEISESIELARKYGVSLYTIGLGLRADNSYLESIADQTGGSHFSLENPEKLDQLYSYIRNRVLNEFYLTYPATMTAEDQKTVKIKLMDQSPPVEDEQSYFSATVFGKAVSKFNWLIFITVILAMAIFILLFFLHIDKSVKAPTIQTLPAAWSKGKAEPLTIIDDNEDLIIGNDRGADLTIQQDADIPNNAAKIKKKGNTFTLIAQDSSVLVNNKEIKKKALRSGDVITIGNTQLVFDKGLTQMMDPKKKKK